MKNKILRMQQQIAILKDLGFTLNSESRIVDLGCGNGDLVVEYMKKGFDAYGCDFEFKAGCDVKTLFENGRIKIIDAGFYRLPFEDKSIDLFVSDQVFEHVKDYSTTLSEIRRVLKPAGACLNFFPARYRIIEPHVYIPFASINKRYFWLLLWALLGFGRKKGKTAKETAMFNYKYLTENTFYLTKKEIVKQCKKHFNNVEFSERLFIKHFPNSRCFSKAAFVPFVPWLYSSLRQRVLFLK